MRGSNNFAQYVFEHYGDDTQLLLDTLSVFSKKEYVSVGAIQQRLQVNYFRSRAVLDKLIDLGFASPQIGARPCKMLKPPAN
jgi:hypothetical protein